MLLSQFDYPLPEDLIAQEPVTPRDAARLLALDRRDGRRLHRRFTDLPGLLRAGDLVVVNDTRVVPARLQGRRASPGASAAIEVLLVEELHEPALAAGRRGRVWRALARGVRHEGEPLVFSEGLAGRVLRKEEDGSILLELSAGGDAADLDDRLARAGIMPLPPYISRRPEDPRAGMDRERYQTVYAESSGALAAPTAGLHFTPEVLAALRRADVEVAALTLHVGVGTFQPIRVEEVERHRMLPEWCRVPPEAAEAIRRTRARRGRVVAVGTTVTRALESHADPEGLVRPGAGPCDLFIHPGFRFRVVDALLTNFHLPRSTPLLLACAFAGRDALLAAYAEAIARRYRFFSYGDSMLLADLPPEAP